MPQALTPWSRVSFTVRETAINTLTETRFRTPVSPTVRTGMQIRKTTLTLQAPDTNIPAAGLRLLNSSAAVLSLRNQLPALPGISDAGVIHHVAYLMEGVANVGATSQNNVLSQQGVVEKDWASGEAAGGLIVATAELSLYVQGAGNVNVKQADIDIYYRLVSLTAEELIAAVSLAETF